MVKVSTYILKCTIIQLCTIPNKITIANLNYLQFAKRRICYLQQNLEVLVQSFWASLFHAGL